MIPNDMSTPSHPNPHLLQNSSKQQQILCNTKQQRAEQSRVFVASQDCVPYPYRISLGLDSRQSDAIIQFPAAPPEPPSVKISIYFLHSKECCALIGNSMSCILCSAHMMSEAISQTEMGTWCNHALMPIWRILDILSESKNILETCRKKQRVHLSHEC